MEVGELYGSWRIVWKSENYKEIGELLGNRRIIRK